MKAFFVDITGIEPARKSALMTDDLRKPVIPIFFSFSQPSGLSEPSYFSCFGSRFCLRDSLQAILYATISHCVIFWPLLRSFARTFISEVYSRGKAIIRKNLRKNDSNLPSNFDSHYQHFRPKKDGENTPPISLD